MPMAGATRTYERMLADVVLNGSPAFRSFGPGPAPKSGWSTMLPLGAGIVVERFGAIFVPRSHYAPMEPGDVALIGRESVEAPRHSELGRYVVLK